MQAGGDRSGGGQGGRRAGALSDSDIAPRAGAPPPAARRCQRVARGTKMYKVIHYKLKQKETEARSSLFAITSLISVFALFSGVL